MKMKRILSILLCLLLVVGVLAACSSGEPEDEVTEEATEAPAEEEDEEDEAGLGQGEVNIGIVLPTTEEPRWLQDQAQFEALIDETDYTVEVLFSQGDSSTERTNVETLVAEGIDVLIICAHDAAAAAATVEYASDEGVTVIAYDRLITNTEAVDYYVTFDSFSVGVAQGQYLVDNAEGEGNPLYLYAGASTDNNAFIFFEGAWSVLQPKIADGTFVIVNSSEAEAIQDEETLTLDQQADVIGQVTTDWDFSVAMSLAEAHLTAATADQKGTCYVLAPNDGTARSIADVFADDVDVTEFFITGQDAEVASVQYVIDGKQSMTVFKDTRVLAADAIDMAIAILGGSTPSTDSTYDNQSIEVPSKQSAIVVVTADNVMSTLIDSGYYDAGEFTGLD